MTLHSGTPDERTAVVGATVAAPPERVFLAFTDPIELAAWFWPPRFATSYRLDVREDGEYRVRSDVAGMGVRGRYLEVDRPGRLAMTWSWDDEAHETTVLVELAGTDDGSTEVTVTHGANPTTDARDLHVQGWRDCIGRLVERLAAPSS